MVQIEELQKLLDVYVNKINYVLLLFLNVLDTTNPCKLYWKGLIKRVGFLDKYSKVEYSIHGSGCTVEFENGDIVSFDFLEDDSITFDLFKFEMFASDKLNISSISAKIFQDLELFKENEKWMLRIKSH